MASELSSLIEHELKNKGFYQDDDKGKKGKGPSRSHTQARDEENQQDHDQNDEDDHDATSTLMGRLLGIAAHYLMV
eukprot:scaffold69293_cov23-Tisochrysis_lutea.AAC.1